MLGMVLPCDDLARLQAALVGTKTPQAAFEPVSFEPSPYRQPANRRDAGQPAHGQKLDIS
jgi:hypothetical protein